MILTVPDYLSNNFLSISHEVNPGLECKTCHTLYPWVRGVGFTDIDGNKVNSTEFDYGKSKGTHKLSTGCLYCGKNAVGHAFVKRSVPLTVAENWGIPKTAPKTTKVLSATQAFGNHSASYELDFKEIWAPEINAVKVSAWFHYFYRPETQEEMGANNTFGEVVTESYQRDAARSRENPDSRLFDSNTIKKKEVVGTLDEEMGVVYSAHRGNGDVSYKYHPEKYAQVLREKLALAEQKRLDSQPSSGGIRPDYLEDWETDCV